MNEATIKISNHGRITIPAGIRKKFGLKDGDNVFVFEEEGMIRVVPILSIDELRSSSITAQEMIEMLKKSREEEIELENK